MENWQNNKYWLNEWGERYWYKNSDITITAHRAYHWVDRVIFINEGSVYLYNENKWSTSDRLGLGSKKYSEFMKEQIQEWTPIEDYQEYCKMLKFEYECRKYNI